MQVVNLNIGSSSGQEAPPKAPPVHGGYHPDYVPAPRQGSWSTGLFDCLSDVSNCCVTCWCPCITFGRIAEIADKGSISCGVCGALYGIAYVTGFACCLCSCFYRTRLRHEFNLPKSPCNDCLVHFCCETCALCQEARELQLRGFDLSIGWHGNMEKQNGGGVTMAPFAQPGMHR